jgi:hypothetical protein
MRIVMRETSRAGPHAYARTGAMKALHLQQRLGLVRELWVVGVVPGGLVGAEQ